MRQVGVLLADDLAVELVLADRAGKRTGDPDGARPFARYRVRKRLSPARSFRFRPPIMPPGISTSIEMSPEMNIIAPASDVSRSPA
jgi:hypothetical protein